MTSILYHSGLNYGSTNPLRGELNIIRDSVIALEKNFKEVATQAASGGAGNGTRGVTASLKEVALQIVTLRTEIEGLKTRITSTEVTAASEKKRVDAVLSDLATRMGLTEAAVGAAVSTVSSLNVTVSSLVSGTPVTVVTDTVSGIESVMMTILADEAPATVEASIGVALVEEATTVDAVKPADEDEAASEEILALLRSAKD
jgi:hypothetical protein